MLHIHGSVFNGHIFRFGRKLDVVGVIEHNQIVQTQCTGNASGTLRNFFMDTTVGDVSIDCLVHHLVEPGFEEFGSNSGTYCEVCPCPNGPEVFSIPRMMSTSGCPGVGLPH